MKGLKCLALMVFAVFFSACSTRLVLKNETRLPVFGVGRHIDVHKGEIFYEGLPSNRETAVFNLRVDGKELVDSKGKVVEGIGDKSVIYDVTVPIGDYHTVTGDVFLVGRKEIQERIGCVNESFSVDPGWRGTDTPGQWWRVVLYPRRGC